MYTIFLADDEPAALEYMASIIEKKCPDYRIVGTAGDGKEALEEVRRLKPDVLVFDICMPVMDGLALSEQIRGEGIPVIMIVVSGYSEFNYARRALQNGCMDYLLKPVIPKDAKKVFEKAARRLDAEYTLERHRLLRRLCRDGKIEKEEMLKYFSGRKYYMALARYNGLPARLSSGAGREVFSEPHETILTYGRDEKESLYMFPEELVSGGDFERIAMHRARKEWESAGYCTVILSRKPVSCGEIGETVSRFYQALDRNIVFGKTHVADLDRDREKNMETGEEERILLGDLRHYAEKSEAAAAEQILEKLLAMWIREERPLLWIEHQVREIGFQMRSVKCSFANHMDFAEREYAIEEVFSEATEKEQLIAGVKEILFDTAWKEKKIEKLDTVEFIGRVEQYLQAHLENDAAAHGATKEFGISYTYLGVLFQKYKKMSIRNYMTMLRMEQAKKIIAHDPSALIRSVAERVGYRDQFYFSRVFRAYTGMCPSDFMDSLKNGGQER